MTPTELPTFEATWWPLMLETVPGSGEHLAVAVVVRAASGQSQVRQLISPAALNSMFGDAGKGMPLLRCLLPNGLTIPYLCKKYRDIQMIKYLLIYFVRATCNND